MTSDDSRGDSEISIPVQRPVGQLHNYSVEFRWDFTRRHPYYQMYWAEVHRFYTNPPGDSAERRFFGLAAKMLLSGIGVSGDPVNPKTPIAELLEQSAPGFLSGSFQPVTFRELVMMFIRNLDPATLFYLGNRFQDVSESRCQNQISQEEYDYRVKALMLEISTTPCPDFDKYPDAPLFYMHLHASQNSIESDAKDQSQRWKRRRKIGNPPKINSAKIPDYLSIWDLREGWTGENYDHGRQKKLKEIAIKNKQPLSTVLSKYKQAFELIVGAKYSPETWWEVFGPLKFSKVFAHQLQEPNAYRINRRFSTVSRQPVSISRLGIQSTLGDEVDAGQSFLDYSATATDESDYYQLLVNIRELKFQGLSGLQICSKLDLQNVEEVDQILEQIDEMAPLGE